MRLFVGVGLKLLLVMELNVFVVAAVVVIVVMSIVAVVVIIVTLVALYVSVDIILVVVVVDCLFDHPGQPMGGSCRVSDSHPLRLYLQLLRSNPRQEKVHSLPPRPLSLSLSMPTSSEQAKNQQTK